MNDLYIDPFGNILTKKRFDELNKINKSKMLEKKDWAIEEKKDIFLYKGNFSELEKSKPYLLSINYIGV